MKIRSRNLLTAILVLLSVIAFALGISFMLPKSQKISADALVDSSIVEASGSLNMEQTESTTGNIGVTTSGNVIYFKEGSATTTHSTLAQWFSMKMTVPAYTQYTVSYTIALSCRIYSLASGSGNVQAEVVISRYDGINGALKDNLGATNCAFNTVNQPKKYSFTKSNFVFCNNTAVAQDFKVYFKLDFKTTNKPRATAFNGSFWWDDYVVEAASLSTPNTTDTLEVDYDGNEHTVNYKFAEEKISTDLDGNSYTYSKGYENVDVTVEAVDGNGATTNAYTYTPSTTDGSGSITATQAGTYTIKFNLSSSAKVNGIEWNGGGQDQKTITLKIKQLKPTLTPIIGEGPFYTNNNLFNDVSITTTDGDTPGTISWDSGQELKAGKNNYSWTFTPDDENNYESKTGTASITVEGLEIKEIKVKFTPGSTKFYTSSKLDDLKAKLGVFKVYNDGTESVVPAEDYELDGDISTVGKVTIGVTYTSTVNEKPAMEEFKGSFEVDITEVKLKSISAVFAPTGDIYLSSELDDLKPYLTVTGTYNDGSTGAVTDYTLTTAGGALSLGTVTVTVTSDEDNSITDTFTVTVLADPVVIELPIPEAGELTYSGEEFDIIKELTNLSEEQVLKYLDVTGESSGRNAGGYKAKFKIKDEFTGSVKWQTQSATPTGYGLNKGVTVSASLSADGSTVELEWTILKAKVSAYWDGGNAKWVVTPNNIAETTESNFLTQVYTNSDGKEFNDIDKLAGGRTYQVTARINPAYANNIELDEGTQALMDSGDETYTYTPEYVPSIWEKILTFLKANWLWLVIGLAALILLIIIIVVAVKRRKSKEEREAKKAAKEEEKARREEERRLQQERIEEERRLQREKLEAEREIAKAKQEAELEKIRAQAQLSGAAGIASVAAVQPQQQPQAVQVTDNSNNELLREMREQMAELRADNKATQAQLLALQNKQQIQQPQTLQQPMYPQLPMQMPMSMQMPMQSYGGDAGTLARLEAQINAMQAEQRARYDAEQRIELAAFRAESHVDRDSRHSVDLAAMREHFNGGIGNYPQQQQGNPIDALGAIVAAALKTIGSSNTVTPVVQPTVAELPQQTGQSATVTAKYPPDAVVTTTTTVDTTKNNGTIRRDENFDIDGFYDPLD